jgi:hypothetical protein
MAARVILIFTPLTDRERHDCSLPIQHGKFYFEDGYPDSHLFTDAEVLRRDWSLRVMMRYDCRLTHLTTTTPGCSVSENEQPFSLLPSALCPLPSSKQM